MSSYPGTIDTFTIPVSGTTLTNNPSFDHAAFHNQLGSAVGTIENLLGTNAGTLALQSVEIGYIREYGTNSGTTVQIAGHGTVGVNYLQLSNNGAGSAPQINPIGGDSNIGIDMNMKGTAPFRVFGTTIQLVGTTLFFTALGANLITPIVYTEYSNGNIGTGNFTVNWSNGDRQYATVNQANGTINFASASAGQVLSLWIYEDATGTRPINIPTIKWPGTAAPTFATAASNVNSIVVRYDGANYYGNFSTGYG